VIVEKFTEQQLRQRAFVRAAWVLQHYWEEQQHDTKRDGSREDARVHSRLFDPLIYEKYVFAGTSTKGGGYKEHLVPCAMLRNHAFEMYWDNKSIEDVALMLEKFLRIAHITSEEARRIDFEHKWKSTMPPGWNFETGSATARLTGAGIELIPTVQSF
jgi:hypothetical protein